MLLLSGVGFAGVERFIKPIHIIANEHSVDVKTNAVIRSPLITAGHNFTESVENKETLEHYDIEYLLSKSLKNRFQVDGEVVVKLTSSWSEQKVPSSSILKITEVLPDELTSSSFVRFSLWNAGQKLGDYSVPIRVSHLRNIFVSSKSIPLGAKLCKEDFKLQKVDVLKQHANSVTDSTTLTSYQLDAYLQANTPLKWNHISRAKLIRKGQVVDVFASGNGIYVTMKGLALEDGVMDSFVKVKNLSSDKEFQAKVLSQNSVKVSL